MEGGERGATNGGGGAKLRGRAEKNKLSEFGIEGQDTLRKKEGEREE